jgi:hypothetical protein
MNGTDRLGDRPGLDTWSLAHKDAACLAAVVHRNHASLIRQISGVQLALDHGDANEARRHAPLAADVAADVAAAITRLHDALARTVPAAEAIERVVDEVISALVADLAVLAASSNSLTGENPA